MKMIAKINCGSLALAAFLVTGAVPALGQGTLIVQHSGATDPVTEGFQNLGPGSGYPVINDMGVNAWGTPGMPNQYVWFKYALTPQQQAASAGADWILSADLRITTTNSFPSLALSMDSYGAAYGLEFGSDSNGDQYVIYGSGSTDHVILPGSTYNDYQLRYDASADSVSLWINGVEYANNIFTNQPDTYLVDVGWGGGDAFGQNPLANWNLVSLTIPEPSSAALFLLGGGALIYIRRNHKGK
jgi:hypothetical protein